MLTVFSSMLTQQEQYFHQHEVEVARVRSSYTRRVEFSRSTSTPSGRHDTALRSCSGYQINRMIDHKALAY